MYRCTADRVFAFGFKTNFGGGKSTGIKNLAIVNDNNFKRHCVLYLTEIKATLPLQCVVR